MTLSALGAPLKTGKPPYMYGVWCGALCEPLPMRVKFAGRAEGQPPRERWLRSPLAIRPKRRFLPLLMRLRRLESPQVHRLTFCSGRIGLSGDSGKSGDSGARPH